LPQDLKEAVSWLLPLINAAERGMITAVSLNDFRRGWFSVGFIHYKLHPDSVLQNGAKAVSVANETILTRLPPELVSPIFVRSGWPIKLIPVGVEARRRFARGLLSSDEYYYSAAQRAGLHWAEKEFRANGNSS
jgi:DNA (cytosine-5)-methyltransferase 1